MEFEIKHDATQEKFYTIIDGQEAVLEYYSLDNDTLVFNHTYVPPPLRGKGIAAVLTKYALNYAREHNFKVLPQCSYVVAYVERNKEFDDIVVS